MRVLVLVAIIGFVASFAISLGPVMWVLLSEIFPERAACRGDLRRRLLEFAGERERHVHLPVGRCRRSEPAGTFLAFGLFASAALVFVLLFVPETQGPHARGTGARADVAPIDAA